MTKLAFSSLLFFTVLSMITAAPVTEIQTSIKNGRSPSYLEHDGLNRQVDNRMDRSGSTDFNLNRITAGDPLENGFEEAKPTVKSKEEAMEEVVSKLECYLKVPSKEQAEAIVNGAYHRLSDQSKDDLLNEDEDIYMPALRRLLAAYRQRSNA